MHYSNPTKPSIAQSEYLQYMQLVRTTQMMRVEMELPVIDVPAVERTITFFLQRHEGLRTIFPKVDNEMQQAVLPATDGKFRLEYVDATDVNDQEFFNIRQIHYDNAAAAFLDIENGPLVKMVMFRRSKGYFFTFLIHHILFDEWSSGIARRELAAIYESFLSGNEPALQPLPVTLQDYCEQQNEWLCQNKQYLAAFWKHKLRDFDTAFDITSFQKMYACRRNVDFPERTMSAMFSSDELSAILNKPDASSYTSVVEGILFKEMKSLAAENKSTLSSFIYASFFLLLYAYTGKKQILIPVLIADRYQADYQQLIGCLLGSMYLSVSMNERSTISELIAKLNDDIMDVIMNRQLIFSHDYLQLDGGRLRNCCDIYINYISKQLEYSAEPYNIGQHENVDAIHSPIYALIIEYNNALVFVWKYNKYLFIPALMEDIAIFYREILEAMVFKTGQTIGEIAGLLQPHLVPSHG